MSIEHKWSQFLYTEKSKVNKGLSYMLSFTGTNWDKHYLQDRTIDSSLILLCPWTSSEAHVNWVILPRSKIQGISQLSPFITVQNKKIVWHECFMIMVSSVPKGPKYGNFYDINHKKSSLMALWLASVHKISNTSNILLVSPWSSSLLVLVAMLHLGVLWGRWMKVSGCSHILAYDQSCLSLLLLEPQPCVKSDSLHH